VLDTETAFLISHTLLDNNARSAAFGTGSYLNVSGHPEVSVKTGTTNDRRDNWTIGYTQNVVVVSWVGNNDNTAMSGAVSGVSGASPIWNKIIKEALNKAESGYFDKNEKGHSWPNTPSGIKGSTVCATTGNDPLFPGENPACPARFEYFLQDRVGARVETGQKDLLINKLDQTLANSSTPPDQTENQNHPFLLDPLGTLVCLNCPIPTSQINIGYPLNSQ
jgi:membrane peptidoglycan carboxypeptidase